MRFDLWPDLRANVSGTLPDWRALGPMQVFAQGGSLKDRAGALMPVHSASTANNLTLLSHLFLALRPERTLEVGLAFGASATLFLSLHQHLGRSGLRHHAVDPFQESDWGGCALLHLAAHGLDRMFRHHARESCQALPGLMETGESFGLIYIDGSHWFEDVMVDFHYAHRLLEMGGIVVFDDFSSPHVAKVVRFIRRNLADTYEELPPYVITSPRHARLKTLIAGRLRKQQTAVFRKVAAPFRAWDKPLVDF